MIASLDDLMRDAIALELWARRWARGFQVGEFPTATRGDGLLFEEARPYQEGDPVKRIDWNLTARLDEPYVKLFREERRREVWIAVDVSPSMAFGLGAYTKLEVAIRIAAMLGVSATEVGDRLGLLAFADTLRGQVEPGTGRSQLFRVLRELLTVTREADRRVPLTDPRVVVHALEARRRRGALFLISDFLDHDLPEDFRYLRPHHDVSLIHVFDPREGLSAPLVLPWMSPEGSTRAGRRGWPAHDLEAERDAVSRLAARHGFVAVSISTDGSVRSGLERLLRRARRHRS